MESEITLDGGEIAYDSEMNLLLVPQDLSKKSFDGTLQVPDGKLYFMQDEALEDKEQRGKTAKLDYMNEDDLKYQFFRTYQVHVNGVIGYVNEAMGYAGNGEDISGSLEFLEMNYSDLISDYNDYIVG